MIRKSSGVGLPANIATWIADPDASMLLAVEDEWVLAVERSGMMVKSR
jgi:hypothetical protein